MNSSQKAFWHLPRSPHFSLKTSLLFMLLATFIGRIQTMNYIELEETDSDVRKSSMISFSKGEINNFYNYQYFARMQIGSPGQKFDVILDTGSHLLWVPSTSCTNCPNDYRKFDSQASSSTVPLPLREHIRYGRGEVEGYYAMENVSFQGLQSRMNLLLVDQQTDTEHSQADGIMGLSNFKAIKNVFDIGYKSKQLISSKFAFELGLKELKQQSYFIYNISEQDYPQAVYINVTDRDYWNIPVREVSFGNATFKNQKALVDSGTSLILVPQAMFDEMNELIFNKYCTRVVWTNSRKCKCPHEASYPNLTITSSSLRFNITPQAYISGSYNRRNCILGIQATPTPELNFIILGDVFFHGKTVIFDKQKNQIGFISNAKRIYVYPQNDYLLYLFDAIALLGLASAIAILMMRRKKLKGEGELSEKLRSGEMELAGV